MSAAEHIYRDLLNRYPDEVEGWFWLGDLLLQFNPVRGRSIGEAREPLERALTLDALHNRALVHLIEVAALQRRYAEADSLIQRLDRGATFAMWIQATQAASRGDSSDRVRVRGLLERLSDVDLNATVTHTMFLLDDRSETERLASILTRPERPPVTRARGHVLLATLAMARGQRGEAQRELANADTYHAVSALEHRAMLATLPFLDTPHSLLVRVQDDLLRWDTSARPPGVTMGHTFSMHGHVRAYLLGLVNGRLGNGESALRYADSLERIGTAQDVSPIARDLANRVRAHTAWRQGDLRAALTLLERVPHRRGRTDTNRQIWRPFFSQLLERFLHGEVLMALEREREARGWFESFVAHDGYTVLYHAPVARRLGEIAQRSGEPEATEHYRHFLDLWADVDAELEPQVDDVRTRLAALGGRRMTSDGIETIASRPRLWRGQVTSRIPDRRPALSGNG